MNTSKRKTLGTILPTKTAFVSAGKVISCTTDNQKDAERDTRAELKAVIEIKKRKTE
jgi:hypothetical protein